MPRATRVLAIAFLCQLALNASIPATGIYGTAHDLSATGLHSVTQAASICVFCHAVHRSASSANQLIPAWNHTTTGTTFKMYNSANVIGTTIHGQVDAQPTGPSLACLSCHDGTVAMGSLVNSVGAVGATTYTAATGGVNPVSGVIAGGPNLIGSDLSNDHPISITYQDNLNAGLVPATSLVGVRLYPGNATGGKVQCSSCHDVHNYGVAGATAPFLRVTMVGSALCRSCHLA